MKQVWRRRRPWLALGAGLLILLAGLILWRDRALSAPGEHLEVALAPSPGRYLEDVNLRMSTGSPDATIYYTLDGRPPAPATAQRYTEPLHLSAAAAQVVVVRARAFGADGRGGPEQRGTYVMGLQTGLPVLSLIVDPADLYDPARGIYVNHEARGRDWERPVDVTFVTGDGVTAFQTGAGLRIHGSWTRSFYDKKSLRLYFRDAYGARKLAYPVLGEQGQTEFDHLYLDNSDTDLLLFRNRLTDLLAADMGAFATRGRPVLLFINGQPWGIFHLRERIDERFLRQNYGVPSASIIDTPNNVRSQPDDVLVEDLPHWEALLAFVREADLANPDSYAHLRTQMDVRSFVDYYLLQMYIANTDWPHHNVEQFRSWSQGGRWEFIPWDNNMAFERADRQMVEHVLEVMHPLGEGMEILLNKLLANPEFRNLFLTRAADLLNTSLSAAKVGLSVERLLAELEQDVGLEQARWNAPGSWEDMAVHMRDFAARRPELMREHFVESFELPGTAVISFAGTAPGGWVAVNDSPPQPLPWQGTYFRDTTIRLRAVPPPGMRFAGWGGLPPAAGSAGDETVLPVGEDLTLEARFVPLLEGEVGPGAVRITAVYANDGDSGDWFELQVGPQPVDLRGWRLTDNDTVSATDEGSLRFRDVPLVADLPPGTTLRIYGTINLANDGRFPADGWQDGVLVLYAGNETLDAAADPWFNLGAKDNLLLLAPGLEGEAAIDLWSSTTAVQPADFGLPPP